MLVLLALAAFITGDLNSPELVLAQPVAYTHKSHEGSDHTVTVYGRIDGRDAPYRVVATHKKGRKTVVDAETRTSLDGTYRLTIKRTSGLERITVIGAKGKEKATTYIVLHRRVDYRLDGWQKFRLRLWFFPVFGY